MSPLTYYAFILGFIVITVVGGTLVMNILWPNPDSALRAIYYDDGAAKERARLNTIKSRRCRAIQAMTWTVVIGILLALMPRMHF